jgi:hypothetical protein
MSILFITYDLNKPRQEYSELYKTMKSFSPVHLSESLFAIKTDKSIDVVYGKLRKFIYKHDYLLVMNTEKPFTGKMNRRLRT